MVTPALPPPAIVAPEPGPSVSAALTDANVRVTSAFSGAQIVLYGAVFDPETRPSDVVVIVRGPDQPIRIARKVRVAGLWVNSRPVVFEGAPGFYMAASSRPLTEIASFSTLRRLGAGIDHLPMNAPEEERIETRYGVRDVVVSRLGGDYLEWRRAVIRLKEKANLYATDHDGVRFVDRSVPRGDRPAHLGAHRRVPDRDHPVPGRGGGLPPGSNHHGGEGGPGALALPVRQ